MSTKKHTQSLLKNALSRTIFENTVKGMMMKLIRKLVTSGSAPGKICGFGESS